MAIEKNCVKASASRFDSEFSMGSRSRESLSSDDDELHRRNSVDSEDDDEYDDADSGAGSDDFDLLELGETCSEFCQVGDQTCSIPFELYDLPDLHGVLSLEVWNDCLTEEERFSLTKYLPDMDQETFMRTLKELFEGSNFHFSSPITTLFQMLKGGLCEPRVSLYRQGLSFFQKHQHFHLLRKHHDTIVTSFLQMRDSWKKCKGYSIEEKLRVLSIVRSQKSLMGERNYDMGPDSSDREDSGEVLWSKRSNGRCIGQKTGHDPMFAVSPALDTLAQGRLAAIDPVKYGKKNPKGFLKLVGSKTDSQNELAPSVQSRHQGYQGLKAGAYGSDLAVSRVGKAVCYDAITGRQTRDQMKGDDANQEVMYDLGSQRDWNVAHCNVMDKGRSFKRGKKHEIFRDDINDVDNYSNLPHSVKSNYSGNGRNLNINKLSDIKVLTAKPSNIRAPFDPAKKAKYLEPVYEGQIRSAKGRAKQMTLKGNLADFADEPYWSKEPVGETYFDEPSFDYEHGDVSYRKKMGRELSDSRRKTVQAPEHQVDDRVFHPKKRTKLFQENIGGNSLRNGGSSVIPLNGGKIFHADEETESDSSDQLEEEDNCPLIMTKLALQGRLENSRSSLSRSVIDRKKEKCTKKDVKESALIPDGILPVSSTVDDFSRHMQVPDMEAYSSKTRHKVKFQHPEVLQDFPSSVPEGVYGGLGISHTESNKILAHTLGRNGQLQAELGGRFPLSMTCMTSSSDRRQKGNVNHDFSLHQSKYLPDYIMEDDDGVLETDPIRDSAGSLDITLSGLKSSVRKQKEALDTKEINGLERADCMQSHPQLVESFSSRKRFKKRLGADIGSPDAGISELPVAEVGLADMELDLKPQKKPFTLITPTIHTGFSFSIIHLLSAVRMAFITPNPEDSLELGMRNESVGVRLPDVNAKHEHLNGSLEHLDVNNPVHLEQRNTPSLTVQEIVDRVKSNPGDPCILETQEPLQDLVRGVLKIFSSRTAPLGAKGWKSLVCYEKSSKCWSWTGPTPESSADLETLEEVTSPDAWRIPHKMLVKLVDSFANWLKSGQETLQQIGSLPPPPSELLQLNYDEKERFRDLRAQKSLITIHKSSDEIKAYFRKEEQLRYSVPDRAFSYTAADGKKSIVAPLRRCGGKPTSKARDHFMLKPDRPPHVTVLCLVRDAAARLPGSIGTRADVCTLLRDSQYIVDPVTDTQVNQVVSGALDRLHYERDPCVQFDGERKLWVYLHREREEEDFEDDGTSSTKKWKRQKKDASEQDDQVTVACHGSGEATGFDMSSDLNVEPSGANKEVTLEGIDDDTRQRTEDDEKQSHVPEESKMRCQENSADEDFDD